MAFARKTIDLPDLFLNPVDLEKAKKEEAAKKPAATPNPTPPASPAIKPKTTDSGSIPLASGPEIQPEEIKYFEKIGGGCFGEVYRGKCRGIEVAVKKLNRQDLDEKTMNDFKKEVEIMAKFNHPNVVLYMGACTTPGHMAIVTELMPNGNVAQVLHNPKVEVSLKRRMNMARDAALGMTWLHESNPCILHRDLKPSNLLIDKSMKVKVCDFGLSVVKPRGEVLRDKDSIPGTPLWMSPEVLSGKDVDEKSDVYSYGIVLWEILTKTEPFAHHNDYVTFKRSICVKNERPPIPDDCLPSLKYLMEACWDKDTAKRPSFRQILPLLDIVIIDSVVKDETSREFWQKEFLGRDEIKWEEFVDKLMKRLGQSANPADLKVKCLKAVIAEKSKDETKDASEHTVTLEKFGKVTSIYGPLICPTDPSKNIVKKIFDILQNDWFHGEISKDDAESVLTKKPKGTFLVRLSEQGGCFTISKMSQTSKINHQRINHKYAEEDDVYSLSVHKRQSTEKVSHKGSLKDFIKKVQKDLNLETALPGSPYRHLFGDKAVEIEGMNGYVVEDDDFED